MFNTGDTIKILFIVIFIFNQMCTKRLVNMCEKFWENMPTGFWLMDFASNWLDPSQRMHKWTRSNMINHDFHADIGMYGLFYVLHYSI